MVAGEEGADYVMFGVEPGRHDAVPLLVELCGWWTGLFVLPCAVDLRGLDADPAALAGAGADFVAVREAVWQHPAGAARGALDSAAAAGRGAGATTRLAMKVNVNEIKPGYVIEYRDKLWTMVKGEHVKPGKGPAYLQAELKMPDRRHQAEPALQHLRDGRAGRSRPRRTSSSSTTRATSSIFMNQASFEQITLPKDDGRRARALPRRRA